MLYELNKQKIIHKTIEDCDIEAQTVGRKEEMDEIKRRIAPILSDINEEV